jgi:5-methylcytosine-specific restriction endonuclease McrA
LTRPTNVEALIAYTRRNLTQKELAAFVVVVTARNGVRVEVTPDYRVWEEAAQVIRESLPEERAARYLGELIRRKAKGAPLVRASLVARFLARPIRQARNADELDEVRRYDARRAFFKNHDRSIHSRRFSQLRAARMEIAGGLCESCGRRRHLQLHHLHYDTLGRERIEDLRLLCDDCHTRETARQNAIRRARWRGGSGTRRVRLLP